MSLSRSVIPAATLNHLNLQDICRPRILRRSTPQERRMPLSQHWLSISPPASRLRRLPRSPPMRQASAFRGRALSRRLSTAIRWRPILRGLNRIYCRETYTLQKRQECIAAFISSSHIPVFLFGQKTYPIISVIYTSIVSYVSAIRLSSPTISSGSIGLRTFLYAAIVRSWAQFPGVRAMIYSFSTS